MVVRLRVGLARDLVPRCLSPHLFYRVLEVTPSDYRLLDDDVDPVLYEKNLFQVVDPAVPEDWVTKEYGESKERYAQSSQLDRYIWEDYHDGVPGAVAAVKAYLARVGPCSWPAAGDDDKATI